jgi:predicted RNA binding protein YcfA (HicA-like mRNA interferase family)
MAMTGRRRKLLEELEQKRRAASPDLVDKALRSFGYEPVRQSGSHRAYRRAKGGPPITMPYRRPHVRQYFVDQVVGILGPMLKEEI